MIFISPLLSGLFAKDDRAVPADDDMLGIACGIVVSEAELRPVRTGKSYLYSHRIARMIVPLPKPKRQRVSQLSPLALLNSPVTELVSAT